MKRRDFMVRGAIAGQTEQVRAETSSPTKPLLTVWEGGQHKDHATLRKLFYKHKNKVRVCLSGHQHLLDRNVFNGVHYFCNGAMSGFWWSKGDASSAAPYHYQETAPGYAILKLYEDGSVENQYHEISI